MSFLKPLSFEDWFDTYQDNLFDDCPTSMDFWEFVADAYALYLDSWEENRVEEYLYYSNAV